MSTKARCSYQGKCSGCDLLDFPLSKQQERKTQDLQKLLQEQGLLHPQIEFIAVGDWAQRDRLDFTWQDGKLGLYEVGSRNIVDLSHCPQLSPALGQILTEFRKFQWPIKKASFRLRAGPLGNKGLWIDCANIDVKKLLDDRNPLVDLLDHGFIIEIGQKGKSLIRQANGELKLGPPKPEKWFSTFFRGQATPIYSLISSFTQPSLTTNFQLTKTIHDWCLPLVNKHKFHIVEFGSGIGNLSLGLAAEDTLFTACEYESTALDCFEMTAREFGLASNITFLRGDFQNRSIPLNNFDLALVNPPRSGLKQFAQNLIDHCPEHILYMSCFPETMSQDINILGKKFSIKKVSIFDQFPNTKHYEVLTLLERHKTKT